MFNSKSNNSSNQSFSAEEILFEGSVLRGSKGFEQYEAKLTGLSSYLPMIAVLLIGLLFASRIYALQNETERDLSQQATHNLYEVHEVVANRGEIFDRNNVPLVWNTKELGADFANRNYIKEEGFTHILGFISPPLKDNNDNFSRSSYEARAGVEKVYDELLQGSNGSVVNETNAGMSLASGTKTTEASPGQDLILSIDSNVQIELYQSLKSLVEKVGFARGSGAIMNIETGELIALTNYPEYSRDFNQNDSEPQYINLFTHGLFTPGSTVKPFIALAALQEGVVNENKHILSTKTITIPNRYNPANPTYFSDWKAHGMVDVRDALAVSSNAYFYAVGGGLYDQKGIGIKKINEYMSAFGLGEPAGVAGFEEINGVVPSIEWKAANYPDDPTWRLGDTFNTSIGQYGWQVTPLQMLRAVAAIANRGIMVEPTLKLNGEQKNTPVSKEIDDHNYQVVHEGMRQCVTSGICQGLNLPYLQVASKTGTAELGISKANVNSWVTGFWPYANPKYAFVVMMNEGSRYNLTGATFVMRQLFDRLNEQNSPYVANDSTNQ